MPPLGLEALLDQVVQRAQLVLKIMLPTTTIIWHFTLIQQLLAQDTLAMALEQEQRGLKYLLTHQQQETKLFII